MNDCRLRGKWQPVATAIRFLALLVACLWIAPVSAQPVFGPTTITVTPPPPTSANSFQVNVSSASINSCVALVVDGIDTIVVGAVIEITAFISCGSFIASAPYAFTVTVGPLSAGAYTIQHFRRLRGGGFPTLPYTSPSLAGTLPITVVAAAADPIPTLNDAVLVSLMLLLGLAGWHHLRKAGDEDQRRIKRHWSLVVIGTALIFGSALLGPSTAQAQTGEESAKRQLIVLFDPRLGPRASEEIVAAVAAADPVLTSLLGHPIAARRLLPEVASAELKTLLAQDRLSPRALLEQYVVLTYGSEAAALAAFARLNINPLVLSVERNLLLSSSVTPTDCYLSEPHAPPCQTTPAGPGNHQWGLHSLRFPQAWDKVRGQAYVAVVDSGIVWVLEGAFS